MPHIERANARIVGTRRIPPAEPTPVTEDDHDWLPGGMPDDDQEMTPHVGGLPVSDWRASMEKAQTPKVFQGRPTLRDEVRKKALEYISAMRPSQRVAMAMWHRSLSGESRRKLISGERLIIIVDAPSFAWVQAIHTGFQGYLYTTCLEANVEVPLRIDLSRADNHRGRVVFNVESAVELYERGANTLVVVLPKQGDGIGLDVCRALSHDDVGFHTWEAFDDIDWVVGDYHPGFAWPKDLDVNRLQPTHLDFAVKRGSSSGEVAHILGQLLTLQTEEEIAETENQAAQMAERATAKVKTKAAKGIEILRPTSSKLAELTVPEAFRTWAEDLKADVQAVKARTIMWSQVDRGLLIPGPPGTGKTFGVRALAAELEVNFLPTSYRDWQAHDDGHLGHLLARENAVFEAAIESSPCILFIDELDAIAGRDVGGSRSHAKDWWMSINAALNESIDKAMAAGGVIVIGACNYPDQIDSALVRSGRLDRRIEFTLPDERALRGIFSHHLPTLSAEAIEPVAVALAGAISPADVSRFAREAGRTARRSGREVTVEDLMSAALPADDRPEEMRRLTAVHESGHAVAFISNGQLPQSVSIVPHDGMNGHVYVLRSLGLGRLSDLEAEVVCLLSGRAAEEVILGDVSAGAGGPQSDLSMATRIITDSIGSFGLSGKLGAHTPASSLVEAELQRLYLVALELIRARRADVEAMADMLLERRVLSGSVLQAFAAERGIGRVG